jgi:hypothetical protein
MKTPISLPHWPQSASVSAGATNAQSLSHGVPQQQSGNHYNFLAGGGG